MKESFREILDFNIEGEFQKFQKWAFDEEMFRIFTLNLDSCYCTSGVKLFHIFSKNFSLRNIEYPSFFLSKFSTFYDALTMNNFS